MHPATKTSGRAQTRRAQSPSAKTRRAQSPCAPGEKLCRRGHVKDYVSPQGQAVCRICNKAACRRYSDGLRRKRLIERRRRIARRPKPPRAERAWAAGHFEGEGTISISSGGAKHVSVPLVTLTSTDKAVIDFFDARWPGYVRSHVPKSRNGLAREAFEWSLRACDPIEGFLLDMRPHLKTARVRIKADLLIKDVRARAEYRKTAAARREKRKRMARMRILNQRGIARPRKAP